MHKEAKATDNTATCHPEGNCLDTDPCGMTASGGAQENIHPKTH